MNKDFLALTYLFSCGALGEAPESVEFDIFELLKYAKEQAVFDTTFIAVKSLFNRSLLKIDDKIFNKFSLEFVTKLKLKLQNNIKINSLLSELNQKNIECILLKGNSFAKLYYCPEARPSGDVDILVSPKDEEKALNLLKEKGFSIKYRTKNGNHSECESDIFGLIELHTSLYYNLMSDIWFNNEEMIKEEFLAEGNYKTLGITDGFLYCFLHAVKHFLSNGLSLRQVMDVLLYIKHYKNEIDFERVNNVLENLKYKNFLNILIGIANEYMAFKKDDLIECVYKKEEVDLVLQDMFEGGVFGRKRKFGNAMYYAYSAERYKRYKKRDDFNKVVTQNMRHNAKGVISLKPKNLKKRYNYLKKSIILYPIAVINHFCFLVKSVLKKPRLVKDTVRFNNGNNEKINERLELIKNLDMI